MARTYEDNLEPELLTPPKIPIPWGKIFARELIIIIVMVFVLGTVWLAGNHLIAFWYKGKIAEVNEQILALKKNKPELVAKLHEERIKLIAKKFIGRYYPEKDASDAEEQLMQIYSRYISDDTRLITYLFKINIVEFAPEEYREEIQAFENELAPDMDAITDKVMRTYSSEYGVLRAARDKQFKRLYFTYWLHNIILFILAGIAWPLRYMFKILGWSKRKLRKPGRVGNF